MVSINAALSQEVLDLVIHCVQLFESHLQMNICDRPEKRGTEGHQFEDEYIERVVVGKHG